MAGITDVPFRELAWRLGAGYVVSEMTTGRAELWDTAKSRERRQWAESVYPFAVQIAGADAETVAESARAQWRAGAQIVDINFGCPMKKVCRKAAGSALLKDPDRVVAIARAAVTAVPIPVTAKMRTGWSPENKLGILVAQRLCAAGIAAITVHGRTRACRFEGPVEHETARAIKAAVDVPVFVNGDIVDGEQARRILDRTGADGVMIGRGALGAPWVPGMIARGANVEPPLCERLAIALEHVRAIHRFYGPRRGLGIARKHTGWYLQRVPELSTLRPAFNLIEHADGQLDFLASLGDGWAHAAA